MTINRPFQRVFLIPLFLLLCGFFWDDLTWTQVNETIEREYPAVKNIDVESLKKSLDQDKHYILIDVRKPEEYAVSQLPGAVNITNVNTVTYPKNSPIVVYCSVGIRSAAFAEKLEKRGFTEVLNLQGSIFSWGDKGYPLMRGYKQVKVIHPYNRLWGKLLRHDLHQYRAGEVSPDTSK